MAEGVEARPGGADLLDQRLEDAGAEVAGVDRGAGLVGEEERRGVLVGLGGEMGAEPGAREAGQPDLAAAVLRLRRLDAGR